MIMDDDIGGSNESIRDVGMDVVVTEGDQTSPEESIPAKKFRGGKYDKEHSAVWDILFSIWIQIKPSVVIANSPVVSFNFNGNRVFKVIILLHFR